MRRRRAVLDAPWSGILLTCLAVVLAAPSRAAAQSPARGYGVSVAPGITPRMRAPEVAQIVREQLSRPVEGVTINPSTGEPVPVPPAPKILSVTAVAGAGLPKVDSNLGPSSHPLLWYVRASGAFVAHFGPPGVPKIRGSAGDYLIDDATGHIVGMGIDRPPGAP